LSQAATGERDFDRLKSFSFQQTDGPITSVVRASGSEGPFGRGNMEHRGVEYRIIQGIKCKSAWGLNADSHAKALIQLTAEGSMLEAYSQESLKINFHEIFGSVRFSTFATLSPGVERTFHNRSLRESCNPLVSLCVN
jgi:hypothetical protein